MMQIPKARQVLWDYLLFESSGTLQRDAPEESAASRPIDSWNYLALGLSTYLLPPPAVVHLHLVEELQVVLPPVEVSRHQYRSA